MSDVDKLQAQEEAAAQRAEQAERDRAESDAAELREPPLRATAAKLRHTREISLAQVHPGDNIRTDLPEIQELARSIREVGLLTPLIVRPWNTAGEADGKIPTKADASLDHFRLVAGHRRYAALRALDDAGVDGHEAAACEVREGLSEAEAYALMLTENVQRVPLEAIQAARALRLLLDLNEGMDAATLARSLGLRPAWAQTHIKLLDLPQEVQDRVEAGDLSVTVADLLRKGQSAGRIDEQRVKDLASQVASGAITSTEARAQAGPPPRPNTVPPKTVMMGPDGRPMEPPANWRQPMPRDHNGNEMPRPATPLTGTTSPPPAPMPGGQVLEAAAAIRTSGVEAPFVTHEERLDIYLYGRALIEWADDEYLDDLGIDRVQCEAYSEALEFEERIGAIRHLSHTLMAAARVPAGAV